VTTEERVAILATAAAERVEPGMAVGLGSGSTAEAVVRALGVRVAAGLHFSAVATSVNTRHLAELCGINMREIDQVDRLHLGIDGADEIDPALNLVKGRGGALLWEKLVAQIYAHFLVVATAEKLVAQLGSRMPLPVEIVAFGARGTIVRLQALGCTALIRTGPDGAPFVTDSGNLIVDCSFGPIARPTDLAENIKLITGVVDHGLFVGMASSALIVGATGRVTELRRPGAP
jgi:ribose 5-phosphate isomerase A